MSKGVSPIEREWVRRLTEETLDPKLFNAEYAVRGAVALRAAELKRELASGENLPFDELILCNIGNPHAVQQRPVTFYRQVASALYLPELTTDPDKVAASGLFPPDVVARAQAYHAGMLDMLCCMRAACCYIMLPLSCTYAACTPCRKC